MVFDKYEYYSRAVQSPEDDVKFYLKRYREIRKKNPKVLREDFCGAGAISCEWVKLKKEHMSCGLDLDMEPMHYGRDHYISKLKEEEKQRIVLVQKNVLEAGLPKADIAAAINFSYFFFKERQILKKYYANVYESLNKNGIFIMDIFGGTQCTDAIVDRTKLKDFTYYWDQKYFDPLSNEAQFKIHFRIKNKMYKNVFSYDWRMWSIPEVKDLLMEVGFKEVKIFWEGSNRQGGGNGLFTEVKKGEACLSWIAYIIGVK